MSEPQPRPEDMATLAGPVTGTHVPGVFQEWALVRYVGEPIGEMIPIPLGGLRVGRAPECGLSLPEAEVSRFHAQIHLVVEGDAVAVHLEDLGSTNGTYLNGRRIQARVKARNGDVVRVGSHAFKLKQMDDMERLFHQAVLAQTTVDPLTGVANRATVLNHLEKHVDLARRHRRPLSVVLADLDHFKRVNDTWGHAAGDSVLRAFGVQLVGRLRASDSAGRIGGEEFLLVLPETSGKEALQVAEELRSALAGNPVPLPLVGAIEVTCSMGVAELRPADPEPGVLLARADAALYRAKETGRNRVVLAEG